MLRHEIEVKNEGRLLAQLRRLDKKVQRTTVRKASVAAGRVVERKVKSEFQRVQQTGFTRRSLKMVSRSRRGSTLVRIGQKKQAQFRQRKTTRARGRNLSQIQRAGKPVPIHWIERGTKPHTIRAARGKVLAFRVGRRTKKKSGLAFAKKVRVPGMKGRFPLANATRSSQREAGRAFTQVVRMALQTAATSGAE